jgi:hypothetical protein
MSTRSPTNCSAVGWSVTVEMSTICSPSLPIVTTCSAALVVASEMT